MIFNTDITQATNWDAVKESKYEVGLEGALMHVYETECNYNALMKAAGLSELKYFKETGGDLFVNEAGALSSFVEKAKKMFMSIIEKIKGMFKKFAMLISSYTQEDKTFLKKYKVDILKKKDSLKGFEFKGYDFKNIDSAVDSLHIETSLSKIMPGDAYEMKDEGVDNIIKANRGAIVGDGQLDESDFKDKLKGLLYNNDGDKTGIDNISLIDQVTIIENTKTNINKVEEMQKKIIGQIDDYIKELDKMKTAANNAITTDNATKTNIKVSNLNSVIRIYKAKSQDYTTAFGSVIQAYKDRNRQAKAICVRAITYKNKNEAANMYENAEIDDIFNSVVIQ